MDIKRIVSVFMSAILILSMCDISVATENEIRYNNEALANQYYTEIIICFEKGSGYPSNYGGAYINQNSGNLVICLKEDSKAIREMYYSISGADKLEFKKVKYSLNELFSIARQVNNYAYLTGKMPQIESSAIIQKDNRVECYTSISQMQSCIEHSYDNKEFFVDNFEYKDAIIFKASDGLTLEASAGGPGYGINTISSSGSVGSIGYLAYRNNGGVRETGFVTAGHVMHDNLSSYVVYNSSGSRIGLCTFTTGDILSIPNYGDTDVAFIKIDSGTTISTTVRNTTYQQDMSI